MNEQKWHLKPTEVISQFFKQKSSKIQISHVEFEFEKIPSIPKTIIFSKLSGKYLACARLTCKSWKKHVDQTIQILHPTGLFSNQVVAHFSNIQTLNLHFCRNVSDMDLLILSQLKFLKKLNLKRCKEISDEGIKFLAQISQLTYLNIGRCNNVGNEGVESISKNNLNLEYLNIKNLFKLDSGIEEIFLNLTKLTYLNFSGVEKIRDKNLKNLSNLQNLQSLQVQNCPNLTSEIFFGLSNLSQLKKFEYCFQISNEFEQTLEKSINSIGIFQGGETNNFQIFSQYFKAMSKVTELKIDLQIAKKVYYYFKYNYRNFNLTNQLENLKHLSLFGQFEYFRISPTLIPKNLTDLTISEKFDRNDTIYTLNSILQVPNNFQNIKIVQFPFVSQMPKNILLSFDSFIQTSFVDVHFQTLSKIKSFFVFSEIFTNADMIILGKLPNLQVLKLENCFFKDNPKNIRDLTKIRELSFFQNEIPEKFLTSLIQAFPMLKNLRYLNIEGVKNKELRQKRRVLLVKAPQGLELLMDPY